MAAHTLVVVLGMLVMVIEAQNATSERHRRLIPYMTFYTSQNPQPISYSFSSTPGRYPDHQKQPISKLYLANKLTPAHPVKQPQNTQYFASQALYPLNQAKYPVDQVQYPANQALYPLNQVKYQTNQAQYPANQALYPLNVAKYQTNQAQYPAQQAKYPAQQALYPAADQFQVTKYEPNQAIEYLLNHLQKQKYPTNQAAVYPTMKPSVHALNHPQVPQYPTTSPGYSVTPKKPVYQGTHQVDYPANHVLVSEYPTNQGPEYPDNQVVEYPPMKNQEAGNNGIKAGLTTPNDDYYYYDDDDDDFDDVDDVTSPPTKLGPARVTSSSEGGTPGKPGVDYPILDKIPVTDFDCKSQRYKGFFGDPATRCQVWHYCDLNGGQASFLCPNGTVFSQVGLTCDWWFNVRCASTVQLYVLNERLYKYILPATPSFPEDYAGPLVDRYLTLKFEEKMRQKMMKT